ncbi:MAG TPA: prephenate dehydrogenase/arogenate dehydrogenase family protein [Gemmataceae bacterium]|nr:prephenate dehydrogenase/arogenate dehydrogenase family protein [Gemmataceae bacterium]
MRISTLAIVGVGLLGGSIALAARRRGVVDHIVGTDRDPFALDEALRDGTLDEVFLHPSRTVIEADLVVFCTPVDRIAAQVVETARHCRSNALLTDVGSTKAAIVREVQGRIPNGVEFIGSHPLAGSEKHGFSHASAQLFDGRLVIVTPTAETSDNALSRIRDFWMALGARVQVMDADEHDRALALTSHLPHLLSSALAGILPPELYELTATGFRDTTRLAAGQPSLWSAIFRANQPHVLTALDQLEAQLHHFRQALLQGDSAALETLLQQGKMVRDDLSRR